MSKIVHAHIYDPTTVRFFKTGKNERARLTTVVCERSEECEVFARGECIALQLFGGGCVHGHQTREEGWTHRARESIGRGSTKRQLE